MANNPLDNESQNLNIKTSNYIEGSVNGSHIAGRDIHITQIYNVPTEHRDEGKIAFGMKYLKQLLAFVRYGTKEGIAFIFSILFFVAGSWLLKMDSQDLQPFQNLHFPVAIGLFIVATLLVGYVLRRLFFRFAVPKTSNDQALPSAIKGLMAFTSEDAELFRKLERESELAKLKDFLNNPQIGLVVMMGESGAGKTSLLRAGLSHLLKDKDIRYVYWEARPTEAVAGLLKSITQGLDVELNDLNALLTLNIPAIIVLDQFEQLPPDKAEFSPIFNLLKTVAIAAPPYHITWIVAFRREYSANWRDFELTHQLKQCETLSLKLFSVAQARNVMATLADSAGLNLEQPLLDGFIDTVKREDRLSPVDISIGLLMLQELAVQKQKQELSLADYQFAGGSQGLFVLFLKSKIEERFDDKREQEALFKALLALVDLNRNQRIAEGKLLAELTEQAQGLDGRLLEYALDYFASGQVRLLEKIVRADGNVAYRLPHESMIPALRRLGNSILDAVAQTDLTLQTAFQTWQNSVQKDSRYLLHGKELKQVLQFQQQLDVEGKGEFLRKSIQKKQIVQAVAIVLLLTFSTGSYFGYDYWVEWGYRKQLSSWGMPDELLDYSKQLKTLTISTEVVNRLEWLERFNHLTSLTLDLRRSEISDLSALKNLHNLTSLNLVLDESKISDFNTLKEQKNLTSLVLDFGSSKITDLSALKELESLTSLDLNLSNSEIRDISVLKELKNLTLLNLVSWYTSLSSDLNILKELKNLTSLSLKYTELSDLSTLKELKNLTSLNLTLSDSEITDLNLLKLNELNNLTSLSLDLRRSKISDLNALKELNGLTSIVLDLSSSKVTDLSALKELKNLTSLILVLGSSKPSDLNALKELNSTTSLVLDLGDSKVSDLSTLKELKSLTSLKFYYYGSAISDLSGLKELNTLTSLDLDLSYSNIKDLSALTELKSLASLVLNLRGSVLSDLSGLRELKSLTSLALTDLLDSEISNLNALKELKSLMSLNLNLHGSKISDLNVLSELKSLTSLDLVEISDLSALKEVSAKVIKLNLHINDIKNLQNLPPSIVELDVNI